MNQSTPTPTVVTNSFTKFLSEHRNGGLEKECGTAIQQLVAACADTGKPASLWLKLTVSPSGNAYVVADKLELKLPQVPSEQSIFYATDQNTLSRINPRQKEFELREVERPEVVVRELPTAAAAQAVS